MLLCLPHCISEAALLIACIVVSDDLVICKQQEAFSKDRCFDLQGQQAWDGDQGTMRISACTQIQEGSPSSTAMQILGALLHYNELENVAPSPFPSSLWLSSLNRRVGVFDPWHATNSMPFTGALYNPTKSHAILQTKPNDGCIGGHFLAWAGDELCIDYIDVRQSRDQRQFELRCSATPGRAVRNNAER